jgi:hypothetical protein
LTGQDASLYHFVGLPDPPGRKSPPRSSPKNLTTGVTTPSPEMAGARVWLTLATTFLLFSAAFTIYFYLSVVLTAIGRNTAQRGACSRFGRQPVSASAWSTHGGTRKVVATMLLFVMADFALLPFISGLPSRLSSFGTCVGGAYSYLRLRGISPAPAPLVLGQNNSGTFLETTVAGIVGAAGNQVFGAHSYGPRGGGGRRACRCKIGTVNQKNPSNRLTCLSRRALQIMRRFRGPHQLRRDLGTRGSLPDNSRLPARLTNTVGSEALRIYRYNNHIRVPSFILSGAPTQPLKFMIFFSLSSIRPLEPSFGCGPLADLQEPVP